MSRTRFAEHVHGLYDKADQEGSVTLNKEQLHQFTAAVMAEVTDYVLEEIEQGVVSELREVRDAWFKEFEDA